MSDQLNTYLKVLNTKHPSTLFHYTTPAGLLGIANSKKIWATDIRFLNDQKEIQHSLDITSSLIHRCYKVGCNNDHDLKGLHIDFIEFLIQNLGDKWKPDVYVASFTEEGDLLSQWRGYCPKGGFSIGFNFDLLTKIAGVHDCFLLPCVYEIEVQKKIIKELLVKYSIKFEESIRNNNLSCSDELAQKLSMECMIRLFAIAPMLKHESFKEEKEWRIVNSKLNLPTDIHFRSNDSEIIPYTEIPICGIEDEIEFNKIFIGPSSMQKYTKDAVLQVIRKSQLPTDVIELSNVPYKSD